MSNVNANDWTNFSGIDRRDPDSRLTVISARNVCDNRVLILTAMQSELLLRELSPGATCHGVPHHV